MTDKTDAELLALAERCLPKDDNGYQPCLCDYQLIARAIPRLIAENQALEARIEKLESLSRQLLKANTDGARGDMQRLLTELDDELFAADDAAARKP